MSTARPRYYAVYWGLFTHTLRCAMLRCASKNTSVFISAAQQRAAQRMCEQPLTLYDISTAAINRCHTLPLVT